MMTGLKYDTQIMRKMKRRGKREKGKGRGRTKRRKERGKRRKRKEKGDVEGEEEEGRTEERRGRERVGRKRRRRDRERGNVDGADDESMEPREGDMVVVDKGFAWKFSFGEVIEVRKEGAYLVQWYGNSENDAEEPIAPGWLEPVKGKRLDDYKKGRGERYTHYYKVKLRAGRTKRYTSDTTKVVVKRDNIVNWGFVLINNKVPEHVIDDILARGLHQPRSDNVQ
jgi:hypothetical protein